MDPLSIEKILITPNLPCEHSRGGLKVKAKPSDKIVLCSIARCQKVETSMISGVRNTVIDGKEGERKHQKEICDLLDENEGKITIALIARLSGYSWNRAKAIIDRLIRLKVISDDFRLIGYGRYSRYY